MPKVQQVDGAPVDYSGLPANHRQTMRLYLEGGYEPGSGWKAILSRDLRAVLMVDEDTREALPQIVRWLYNYAPSESWGSTDHVHDWMIARRAERIGGHNLFAERAREFDRSQPLTKGGNAWSF